MSERPQLTPAVGLVRDRVPGPPPRRLTTSPVDQPDVREPDVPEPKATPNAAGAATDRPKRQVRTKVSETGSGGMRRTTLSLPRTLVAEMRQRLRAEQDLTQIQFILMAIEMSAPRLKELVELERPKRTSGGLFPDAAAGRPVGEESATIGLTTTDANLKVIDSLVDQSGADSRSQLVRVALRAALSD